MPVHATQAHELVLTERLSRQWILGVSRHVYVLVQGTAVINDVRLASPQQVGDLYGAEADGIHVVHEDALNGPCRIVTDLACHGPGRASRWK